MNLIESWKKFRDKKGYAAAVLMDLSKAFDTINHELLVAKLHAYGVTGPSLRLLMSYLSNRHQRTKVNDMYSTWEELLTGVPQGSVLGPLLFNIYLNDIFYFVEYTEVCNFADDTTPHSSGYNVNEVLTDVEHDSSILLEWFRDNFMTLNADKCHLLFSGHKHEHMFASLSDETIWEENAVKLLGILIDSNLTFNDHLKIICKKASQKLTAISRFCHILSENKRIILLKTFFESQFNYCPLIWMFCNKTINRKIDRLHERALRLAYKDYVSNFHELLEKDKSVTIHKRNLRALVIEMYKIDHKISPSFIRELVVKEDSPYNTRATTNVVLDANNRAEISKKSSYKVPKINTVSFGKESFRWLGPKLWNSLPEETKHAKSLEVFRQKVKSMTFDQCPCNLCREYVHGVGYID